MTGNTCQHSATSVHLYVTYSNANVFVAVPDEVLFYADSLYGHVGLIDVSSSATYRTDLHLIAYSSRPVGVAYNPMTQVCLYIAVIIMTIFIFMQSSPQETALCIELCPSVCLFRPSLHYFRKKSYKVGMCGIDFVISLRFRLGFLKLGFGSEWFWF